MYDVVGIVVDACVCCSVGGVDGSDVIADIDNIAGMSVVR